MEPTVLISFSQLLLLILTFFITNQATGLVNLERMKYLNPVVAFHGNVISNLVV